MLTRDIHGKHTTFSSHYDTTVEATNLLPERSICIKWILMEELRNKIEGVLMIQAQAVLQ